MHGKRLWLRAALLAALCAPVGAATQNATAQEDPLWISGDRSIQFKEVIGTNVPVVTSKPLPQPNNENYPPDHQYQGEVAQRSQNAQYDRNGELLFFIIDGRIFNANGYLIADNSDSPGDRDCSECFYPGQETHIFPVPGRCSRYYVFSVFGEQGGVAMEPPGLIMSNNNAKIRVGVLDLTLLSDPFVYNNPDCPVRGRFMNWDEQESAGLYMLDNMHGASERIFGLLAQGDDPPGYLLEAKLTGSSQFNGLFRAATIQLENDHRGLAFVKTQVNLVAMLIEAQGMRRLEPSQAVEVYPLLWIDDEGNTLNDVEDNDYTFRGEMAVRQVGSELRLAWSSYVVWPGSNGDFHEPRITIWRMQVFAPGQPAVLNFTMVPLSQPDPNPKTYAPDIYPINTPTPPLDFQGNTIERPAIGGLEFSPNGRYVYFTKSAQGTPLEPTGNFGYIDLNVPCVPGVPCPCFFYPAIGGLLEARKLADTQLSINIGPDGITPALYMLGSDAPGDHWLASFMDADFPGDGFWQQHTLELASIAQRTALDGTTQYRFLNHRTAGSRHFTNLQEDVCCEDFVKIKDQSRPILPVHQVWTPGENAFCNAQGPIYIDEILRIPAGANVFANNMTFRFGPWAQLVVERGARFTTNNCTFTSACDILWAGFRVEGNTNNPYQSDNPSLPLEEEQGRLYLGTSTVENALIGVLASRSTDAPAYNGGVVLASGSTFRNCRTGVLIQNYHRFDGGTIELPYRSFFSGCNFETTPEWLGGDLWWHMELKDVRHIKVLSCSFENTLTDQPLPTAFYGGILLFNATAYVDGNGDPEVSYFRNLRFGILNSNGMQNSVRVKKMHFENNVYGILDFGSNFVEYCQNTFSVADQGSEFEARVGMLLWQTQFLTVEQNAFVGVDRDRSVGIQFVGYAPPQPGDPETEWLYLENKIYNNSFENLAAGNLVRYIHRGNSAGEADAGLQFLCGDYTNNLYDIALLDKSIVRPNQGVTDDEDQLAGNRFTNNADCSSNFDWILDDAWRDIPGYANMVINYKRHEFPDALVGVSCDQWEGFDDIPVLGSGLFVKEVHCAGGTYPIDQGTIADREARYATSKALLTSVIATYTGTVDLGQPMELKDAIQQSNPWLPSANLRDRLLAKHPLSDAVLADLLNRVQPMDPWHLTQVLLQNSKLNPGIWDLVRSNNLLTPFFLTMLEQAQNNQGPTLKQSLEQEIAQRRLEMTEHLTVLGHQYARDTIGTSPDSLRTLLLYDKDEAFLKQRVEALIKLERYSEAQALLNGRFADQNGREVMGDLLAMQQSTGGLWKNLSTSDKSTLYDHALQGKAGAAQAAGILLSIANEAPIPPVAFPNATKSRLVRNQPLATVASADPTITCFPNPSSANTFVTYPPEYDGSLLAIYDSKGTLVRSAMLNGNGLFDLDTHHFAAGMYQLVLPGTTLSVKLAVQP